MKKNIESHTILSLDAGGTNFVFTAIKGGEEITKPHIIKSNGDNLDLCIKSIINGFSQIKSELKENPSAISFAFPGPADYSNGIIGDLGNLPAFKGGIALGPMLEEIFQIPVYINNDGDLFTFGEAYAGILPFINEKLESNGIEKKYNNLFGITLGTGFGAGLTLNNQMYVGDNSAGAEIWLFNNPLNYQIFAEEEISIRGIQKTYNTFNNNKNHNDLSPKDIFEIAIGNKKGNSEAALKTFDKMGYVLGNILSNVLTLLDCNIVIGGGLSSAYQLFAPSMMSVINGKISKCNGEKLDRLEIKAFNIEDEIDRKEFFRNEEKFIKIPNSKKEIKYNFQKKIAIGTSKLGTNKATAIGAYAFAINKLNKII